MGKEIDLLKYYPKTKRNVKERGASKTEADRKLARKFGKEFFDGDRSHGYGGFHYQERFWTPVIPTFQEYFNLSSTSSVLDVGCAKGFMLYDLQRLIPGISIQGIDVSEYAITHGKAEVANNLSVADARDLPFLDNSFDVVISITTLHNFDLEECKQSLKEVERVSRGKSFVTLDAYRTEEEKMLMDAWNLTAKTVLHVDEWKTLFKEVGYTGDYYWFMP